MNVEAALEWGNGQRLGELETRDRRSPDGLEQTAGRNTDVHSSAGESPEGSREVEEQGCVISEPKSARGPQVDKDLQGAAGKSADGNEEHRAGS